MIGRFGFWRSGCVARKAGRPTSVEAGLLEEVAAEGGYSRCAPFVLLVLQLPTSIIFGTDKIRRKMRRYQADKCQFM